VSEDPLRGFEAEHRAVLQMLAQLERVALTLRDGVNVAANVVIARELLRMLQTDVREHNEAEERALFPALTDDPTVTVFIEEHRRLRELERELAESLRAGDRLRIARTALAIVDLLRAHIAREDGMLFPSARQALGPQGLAEVARAMYSARGERRQGD
jgi:hemerythrin-like domain-containing protein